MRKEENLDLLKKLAENRTDVSQFRSSKSLSAGKAHGRLDEKHNKNYSSGGIDLESESDITSDDEQKPVALADGGKPLALSKKPFTPEETTSSSVPSVIGSGLKRPLNGTGNVALPVRKRLRMQKPRRHLSLEIDESWTGFSSAESVELPSDSDAQSTGTQTDPDSESEEGDSGSEPTSSPHSSDSDIPGELKVKVDGEARQKRSSAFKAWATEQMNEALGFQPSSAILPTQDGELEAKSIGLQARPVEVEPLPPELEMSTGLPNRKAFSVPISRSPEVEQARLELPIVAVEQKIMEAIHNNPIAVIWGATGSGKTTQLPQFLYEAGYGSLNSSNPGMIGITQPRRVAAVSMAKRVADEMNSPDKVAYQIRFDSTTNEKTAIKYMTDGILIQEIARDFSLSKYSAIVIDEAHERSTNTDILIGIVSRIVDLRSSMNKENSKIALLKLIIMSATLRISDFTSNVNLFRSGSPPLVEAEGRQYPVTVHFTRRTQRDYVEEAFFKIKRGHKKLPPGSMLVFLTGQSEIVALAKKLRESLKCNGTSTASSRVKLPAKNVPLEVEDFEIGEDRQVYDNDYDEDSLAEHENDDQDFELGQVADSSLTAHILLLYSQLPTKEQIKVFEPPPEKSRLIVLATNVAETSLTIPGIRYVFDCGRAKERKFDQRTGVQSFEVGWISKASASQRAGRAGRTGPGHCYRLYSSAVYERDFPEYSEPEILRTPVDSVVLQLKSMDLQHVVNFPFPTPPDRNSLATAEKLLGYLGAVDSAGKITSLGRELSIYPLSPRFSKILLIGRQQSCMPYTIALVSALIVPDLFIPEAQLNLSPPVRDQEELYINSAQNEDSAREQRRKNYNKAHTTFSSRSPTADALKLLSALCASAYASSPEDFAQKMFLRPKALQEASQLRSQLTSIVRLNHPGIIDRYEPRLSQPSNKQLTALKQILAAGFIDQLAIRADLSPSPPEVHRKPKRAIDVPYLTLFSSHTSDKRDGEESDRAVYVHPSSVLAHLSPTELPLYIVYSHLQRAAPSAIGAKIPKVRMHALTSVSGSTLAALAQGTSLLEYGKPIGKVVALEGSPERRECWVVPSLVGERGGVGWPLPAKKVIQVRRAGGWELEKVLA